MSAAPEYLPDAGDDWDPDAAADDRHTGAAPGRLVDESRRVLVALLTGPFLDGRKDPDRWGQLLRDREAIEARLADLFLELVLDDDAQVAFIRQSEDDPDAPKLLRRTSGLNRLDSLLLLVLRQQMLTQSSRGQRAVVTERELVEALTAYRRSTSTDEAGFNREIRSSLNKMLRYNLIEEQGDSYEISPVLRIMISPDVAREFIALYREDGADLSDPPANAAPHPTGGDGDDDFLDPDDLEATDAAEHPEDDASDDAEDEAEPDRQEEEN